MLQSGVESTIHGSCRNDQVDENQITMREFFARSTVGRLKRLAIVAAGGRGAAMYADLQNRKRSILPVEEQGAHEFQLSGWPWNTFAKEASGFRSYRALTPSYASDLTIIRECADRENHS